MSHTKTDILHLNSAPTHFVSPPVFWGYNQYSRDKKFHFVDTNGKDHIIETFEDAVDVLLNMYSNIIGKYYELVPFIKKSPSGNWAYLSYKI